MTGRPAATTLCRLQRPAGPARSAALRLALAGLLLVGGAMPGFTRASEDGVETRTLLGSYLAGRFARAQHDDDRAREFYKTALGLDPGNETLLEQSFLAEATDGNWPRAGELAEELAAKQPANRLAQVFLGIRAFKAHQLDKADEHFKSSGSGPIGELTAALSRAWVRSARNDTEGALSQLEVPKQAEWAQFYVQYHRALIADVGNRAAEARSAYEKVFKQDNRTLRTTLAFAQHAAAGGDLKLAKTILKEHIERSGDDPHPLAKALRDRLEASDKVDRLVTNANDGLAEVFYGLGEALSGEGGLGVGIVYLQMALYLSPQQPFALAALANAYETAKKYGVAIDTYDRIPKGSGLQNAIDIRKAFDLNQLDRPDEAKTVLVGVADQDRTDIKPLEALGNIMRARKRYEEAAEFYTRAIALLPHPEKRHWTFYYARGTCYERLKKWPLAEADLQKALTLYPDQPLVLNYLGYTWVDQEHNLKQAMGLIEKAVSLKPDDGYIIDSLGWAHFRQSNFKESVKYLERAVELRPEDPVLNDHLGDALWRVGRQREARFQWDQSLSLSPEAEDAEKTRAKLNTGLPARKEARTGRRSHDTARGESVRRRVVTKAVPTRRVVE